jgi:5'-nucleotidase
MESNRPFILVVNDDGISAPGLKFLVKTLKEFSDIFVIAPDKEQSGKSHAISVDEKIKITKINEEIGYVEYTCSGTPVDCVKIAVHQLLKKKPSLCISGINHGANFSISTLYSGTVHAAVEGTIQGIPSIALSHQSYSRDINFNVFGNFIKNIVNHVLSIGLKNKTTLNVNIPDISFSKIRGVKICRQGDGNWIEKYRKTNDDDYYWLTGEFKSFDHNSDTDISAINNYYITIVPIKLDTTDHKYIDENKCLNIDI